MAATAAVVGEFFAGATAVEGGAVAVGSAAATEAAITGEAVFAGYGAGVAGSAAATEAAIVGGAGAAGSAAAGGGLGDVLGKIGTQVATGVGTAVASSLLAPKPGAIPTPTVAPVTPMPDPLAQQDALRKSIIEQTARRGRASTVLTDTGNTSGKLGG